MIGAIVAGGGNTRFGGESKGLRTVAGERIIDRVARALRAVCDEIVLVANDDAAEAWLAGVRGVRVERDARAQRGSLVGLESALRAANGDDVLVVAWDMPFVSPALLAELRRRLAPGISAVLPETPTGLEPFCAAYSASVGGAVEDALDSKEMRASRLIESLPSVVRLAGSELARFGDPRRLFFNVNSAADLDEAERMAREG